MKTVAKKLYDYIENKEHYEVITRNGITISVPDECFLQAEFTFLDIEDARLVVSFRREKKGFVKALGIRNIQDIYALTPGSLMEAYYEGLAEMVCFVALEYIYCMSFQKLGNIIVAENDRAIKHNIPDTKILETPGEFIAYAKQYYKLVECHEN